MFVAEGVPAMPANQCPELLELCARVDRLFAWVREADPDVELKYNKFYIGLSKAGRAWNDVTFRPKKNFVTLEPKLPRSDEMVQRLDEAGLDTLDYNARWNHYRIRLTDGDLETNDTLIRELISLAKIHREA